jgi:EmrB/QacA subfamily drug resistance transporter
VPPFRPVERVALQVAAVASFLTPFMGAAANVALPAIGREFEADAVTLTWVSAAYLLAAAACLVPFGRLADLYGRKRIFSWGLAAYAATSWLSALAPSIHLLIAARALQGAAGAMIFGTNVAILTSVFSPAARGRALGLNVAAVYLGLSLGPFLGGVLTEQAGWRSIFALNVALGLGAWVATRWKLTGEWADARGARFDAAGAALYGAGLVLAMYGLSQLPGTGGAWLVASGLVVLVLFVAWELRVESPVLDLASLRGNRVFAFSNLAAFINYSATFAVGFLLSLYLQYVRGLTAQAAGTLLVVQPLIMALVSPFAGRLSDRVPSRTVASAGMAATALGLGLLTALTRDTPLPAIVAPLAVLGGGFGLFSSPNTNAVMGSVERPLYGVAAAMLGTMRLVGQMFSMAVAMLVLTLFVGRVPITPDRHDAFLAGVRVAFGLFAASCALGTFASLARGRSGTGSGAPPRVPS